jgi:hypothetical protein
LDTKRDWSQWGLNAVKLVLVGLLVLPLPCQWLAKFMARRRQDRPPPVAASPPVLPKEWSYSGFPRLPEGYKPQPVLPKEWSYSGFPRLPEGYKPQPVLLKEWPAADF